MTSFAAVVCRLAALILFYTKLSHGLPNLIFIMTDQQRFDAIRRVQDGLPAYNGRLKIRTPNLDRLSFQGAHFEKAYCQSPVCGPARTSLRSGCTVKRTGVQSNDLLKETVYNRMEVFRDRIQAIESLDQILVEEYGYTSEYYGKWHIPDNLYYKRGDGTSKVINFNGYDYDSDSFQFDEDAVAKKYKRYLEYFEGRGDLVVNYTMANSQQDTYSKYPYTPIQLDSRFSYPSNTPLTEENGFEQFEMGQASVMGRFSLSEDFTTTHFIGETALKALDRMVKEEGDPFLMTVSFHHPHPPMVPASKYLDYYWNNLDDLFVSPSINDDMSNSPYAKKNKRETLLEAGYGYDDPNQVKEWTALYYGLIEEIDHYVGKILDKVEEAGISNNTMIVFTADHGEMLGAHAMREKNVFYEEAVRVPLLISFPGQITPGIVVRDLVSHIDLFSTVLDYLDAGDADKSDGTSMRRFMEMTSHNEDYDESTVVSEWDYRTPINSHKLERKFGRETNFMIINGHYKLIMPKDSSSKIRDVMYDLNSDPYEMHNLLGDVGMSAEDAIIGKAEHLRCLLIEWMQRMNGGSEEYYSNPVYNNHEGQGDIKEVSDRQKWRALDFWVGNTQLQFGAPVWNGSMFVRNEYLYVGRRNSGSIWVREVKLRGEGRTHFSVENYNGYIEGGEYLRIKVTYAAQIRCPSKPFSAHVVIRYDVRKNIIVPIFMICNE
mmetsp:Transcript_21380/g.31300  ORF Transcript_21380/g.31300 Transcript_21380/m.31300 type:complete len:715 (-) Transcript_21380:230-2374(-)